MTTTLGTPLTLPCGATLSNRMAKAAMSEGLADADNHATPRLAALYKRWAYSGAGLLLSGNFQVDRQHLERPSNVVIDDEAGLPALTAVAAAGTAGGSHFWAQLSHTGRQVSDAINPAPLSSSSVDIEVPRAMGYTFAKPRTMTEADIDHAIGQFARSATYAQRAGFTGVQLHAAHGYLISQFLSPLSNRRTDRWGGSLENRSRFLLAIIAAVRSAVGADFPIGIKLNASDFLKGGFTNAECVVLVHTLNDSTLDLLELSGGSLEQPKVIGLSIRDEGEDKLPESTIKREAYFVAFAGAVRAAARMPVMVTGGFRTASGMIAALAAEELDLVGIGRPLIADPSIARRLIAGEVDKAPTPEASLEIFHLFPWFNMQIERMGDGQAPDLTLSGPAAAEQFQRLETAYYMRLLEKRGSSPSQRPVMFR
jgi:2,4-dienoyl-CoA reductase-like NADH-dependent reductase (Old Yellow Enzyme family)